MPEYLQGSDPPNQDIGRSSFNGFDQYTNLFPFTIQFVKYFFPNDPPWGYKMGSIPPQGIYQNHHSG